MVSDDNARLPCAPLSRQVGLEPSTQFQRYYDAQDKMRDGNDHETMDELICRGDVAIAATRALIAEIDFNMEESRRTGMEIRWNRMQRSNEVRPQ